MVERYLDYLRNVKRRSEGTIKQYRSVLREFSKFPLTPRGFEDYLRSISDKSPRTQQFKLSVVKNYLNWLYDRKLIAGERYWEKAEPPREKALPHYLTIEELERFFSVIDDDYYRAVFRLLVNTGMRISELLKLEKSDVTISGNVARIKVKGKGAKERVINVEVEVVEEAIRAGFFERKVSARTIQRRMKVYLERAGIKRKITPHSLRHTFAIILMERGIPLNRIQAILGHESISTTSVYLRIIGEGERIPKII